MKWGDSGSLTYMHACIIHSRNQQKPNIEAEIILDIEECRQRCKLSWLLTGTFFSVVFIRKNSTYFQNVPNILKARVVRNLSEFIVIKVKCPFWVPLSVPLVHSSRDCVRYVRGFFTTCFDFHFAKICISICKRFSELTHECIW